MWDAHSNTIYNKHVNTVVLHLFKAVLHNVAVTIVWFSGNDSLFLHKLLLVVFINLVTWIYFLKLIRPLVTLC